MEEYSALYYKLFNKLTDIIAEIRQVQMETEEMFISLSGTNLQRQKDLEDGKKTQ